MNVVCLSSAMIGKRLNWVG